MSLRKLLKQGEKVSPWLPVVILECPGDLIREITLVREPRALCIKFEIQDADGIHFERFFHDPKVGSFVPDKGEIQELIDVNVSLEETGWSFDSECYQSMKDAKRDITEVLSDVEGTDIGT